MIRSTEPWAAFGKQVINADQQIIAQCKTEEDAARIVACVNALRGIKDPRAFAQAGRAAIYEQRQAPLTATEPAYQQLDIARRTIDLSDLDDLTGPPPLYGVCDILSATREELTRTEAEFAAGVHRTVRGMAIRNYLQTPTGICPHCKAKLNTKTPPICPDCGKPTK